MTERLKAIEERCEKLGWKTWLGSRSFGFKTVFRKAVKGRSEYCTLAFNGEVRKDEDFQAAESLLTLYEPGLMVKIVHDENGRCSWEHCALYGDGGYCDFQDVRGISRPGPDCHEGTFKLVPCTINPDVIKTNDG